MDLRAVWLLWAGGEGLGIEDCILEFTIRNRAMPPNLRISAFFCIFDVL